MKSDQIANISRAKKDTTKDVERRHYSSPNAKIPTVSPPIRIGKTVGISYAAFIVLKMTCSTFLTMHISAAEVFQELILL